MNVFLGLVWIYPGPMTVTLSQIVDFASTTALSKVTILGFSTTTITDGVSSLTSGGCNDKFTGSWSTTTTITVTTSSGYPKISSVSMNVLGPGSSLFGVGGGLNPLKIVVPTFTTKNIVRSAPQSSANNTMTVTVRTNVDLEAVSVVIISALSGAITTTGTLSIGGSDAEKFTGDWTANTLTLTVASGQTLMTGTDVVFTFNVANPLNLNPQQRGQWKILLIDEKHPHMRATTPCPTYSIEQCVYPDVTHTDQKSVNRILHIPKCSWENIIIHSHYTVRYRRRRFNDHTERQDHDNDNFDDNDIIVSESEQEYFLDFSSNNQRNQDGGAVGPPNSK
jgi:hypothetical protein